MGRNWWGPPSGAGKCLFCLGEREKQNKRCKHAIACAHGRSYVKRSLFRFCFLRNIVLQILQVLRYEYVRECGSLSVSAVWVFRTGREGFRRSRRVVPSESLKYLRLQPVPILQISRTSVMRRAASFEGNTPASRTFPRCICSGLAGRTDNHPSRGSGSINTRAIMRHWRCCC